ncbi:AMP-binding protein, partial [Pseudomonadales bacterium]|nr:AMP-binding protein [Pseudomonadales bacterium]
MTFALTYAEQNPDQIAIRDERKSLHWSEVDDVLNRAVNGLRAYDLGPDVRVAVFAENSVETALANLGGLVAGASVVPVNFHLTAEEVAYILSDSGARVLFVGPETAARGVEAAANSGVHTVVGWCDAEGVLEWNGWLAG